MQLPYCLRLSLIRQTWFEARRCSSKTATELLHHAQNNVEHVAGGGSRSRPPPGDENDGADPGKGAETSAERKECCTMC